MQDCLARTVIRERKAEGLDELDIPNFSSALVIGGMGKRMPLASYGAKRRSVSKVFKVRCTVLFGCLTLSSQRSGSYMHHGTGITE